MTKILEMDEVAELTSLSRCTIWRLRKLGLFPQALLLGRRRVGWTQESVEAWMQSRRGQ